MEHRFAEGHDGTRVMPLQKMICKGAQIGHHDIGLERGGRVHGEAYEMFERGKIRHDTSRRGRDEWGTKRSDERSPAYDRASEGNITSAVPDHDAGHGCETVFFRKLMPHPECGLAAGTVSIGMMGTIDDIGEDDPFLRKHLSQSLIARAGGFFRDESPSHARLVRY